jgi:hypothetical protein
MNQLGEQGNGERRKAGQREIVKEGRNEGVKSEIMG